MKRTRLNKKGKSSVSQLRNKCDRLLQEWNKGRTKFCECCGGQNQAGHHWVEKSTSARLRYEKDNIIPLCNSCHCKIHNRFGNSITGSYDVATIIINKRGEKWYNKLNKTRHEIVKISKGYFENILEELCTKNKKQQD